MKHGLSDQVRSVALEKYVRPAIRTGKTHFSVAVRDLMRDLRLQGFPERNWPQICSAIQAEKFLRENELEIDAVDGPPSKKSTTVVVRYRLRKRDQPASVPEQSPLQAVGASGDEPPEARARRLGSKLRGLLRDELAEYGGGEAFIRWVRGYDEEDAA
jgi:hypothetical protein